MGPSLLSGPTPLPSWGGTQRHWTITTCEQALPPYTVSSSTQEAMWPLQAVSEGFPSRLAWIQFISWVCTAGWWSKYTCLPSTDTDHTLKLQLISISSSVNATLERAWHCHKGPRVWTDYKSATGRNAQSPQPLQAKRSSAPLDSQAQEEKSSTRVT